MTKYLFKGKRKLGLGSRFVYDGQLCEVYAFDHAENYVGVEAVKTGSSWEGEARDFGLTFK